MMRLDPLQTARATELSIRDTHAKGCEGSFVAAIGGTDLEMAAGETPGMQIRHVHHILALE